MGLILFCNIIGIIYTKFLLSSEKQVLIIHNGLDIGLFQVYHLIFEVYLFPLLFYQLKVCNNCISCLYHYVLKHNSVKFYVRDAAFGNTPFNISL